MRVLEMSASFTRKVQVKNFEPAECGFQMKVELEEGDSPDDVRAYMMKEVRDAVTQGFQGTPGRGSRVTVQTTSVDEETGEIKQETEEPKQEKPKRRGRPPNKKTDEVKSESWDTVPGEEEPKDNVVQMPKREVKVGLPEIKKLIQNLAANGIANTDKIKEVLATFNVASSNDLNPDQYEDAYNALSSLQSEAKKDLDL